MSETTICFEKTGEFRLPRLSEYWLFEGEVLHGISPAGPDQRREILQRKDMPNVTTLLATAKASNTTLRAQLSTLAQQLADVTAERDRLRAIVKECLSVVDDCYASTYHFKVAHTSVQRERILAAIGEPSQLPATQPQGARE